MGQIKDTGAFTAQTRPKDYFAMGRTEGRGVSSDSPYVQYHSNQPRTLDSSFFAPWPPKQRRTSHKEVDFVVFDGLVGC